jgi:hypothetical protein
MPTQTVTLLLREAKRLHKAASSEPLAPSLPVLRRLLASQIFQGMSLPELRRHRSMVQRKHLLRMLAMEAGCASWEAYRQALMDTPPDQLAHFEIARQGAGQLNLWFSSMDEAQAHVQAHGGRAMRVGMQAVVLLSA